MSTATDLAATIREGLTAQEASENAYDSLDSLVELAVYEPKGERVTVEEAIAVLNRVHALDPNVMQALIEFRVECNEQLADDETVQVAVKGEQLHRASGTELAEYNVGLLGILNGIFGIQPDTTTGYIAAVYNRSMQLLRFELAVPK